LGTDPAVLIALNRDVDEVEKNCAESRVIARFGSPLVMPFENDAPITLCRGLHPPLAELWPKIQFSY
jgi:hypothetical protein